MDVQAAATTIRQEAAAALAGSGVEVEDVAIHPAGKRSLVRITVARDLADLDPADTESPVPSATLDEVAAATRTINELLDESPVMGERPYTLEVTSPGVGQPLTTWPQFRRNVGRLLAVQLTEGEPMTGRLVAAGPDGIRLDPDPDTLLPLDRVRQATVEIEFSRPGSGKD